ncbi:MAG: hypothetical protein JWO98_4902 [Frankiales bacterium]|nr:hypothetical protein [Frankiales bacterium]
MTAHLETVATAVLVTAGGALVAIGLGLVEIGKAIAEPESQVRCPDYVPVAFLVEQR